MKTTLLPLYWRAQESQRPDALVHDPLAVEIVQRIDFDLFIYAEVH